MVQRAASGEAYRAVGGQLVPGGFQLRTFQACLFGAGRCADALVELVLQIGMPLEEAHAVDVSLNGEGNDGEATGGAQSWDVPVRGEKQTGVSVSG
ncbi:hypothetical protein [Streptomyces sp. NPDC000133]|uniref:hypothetical protein n=1 Tax=Streptomyces sp. NPDC000133 TaxID=3364535 RepID=UPI0036892B2B